METNILGLLFEMNHEEMLRQVPALVGALIEELQMELTSTNSTQVSESGDGKTGNGGSMFGWAVLQDFAVLVQAVAAIATTAIAIVAYRVSKNTVLVEVFRAADEIINDRRSLEDSRKDIEEMADALLTKSFFGIPIKGDYKKVTAYTEARLASRN